MKNDSIRDDEAYLEPEVEIDSAVSPELAAQASITICGCCFC